MMGVMALRNQQLDLAEEKLEKAFQGRSPTATAHHNYAMVLLNKGGDENLMLAIKHLGSAVKLEPGLVQAHEMLGMALVDTTHWYAEFTPHLTSRPSPWLRHAALADGAYTGSYKAHTATH